MGKEDLNTPKEARLKHPMGAWFDVRYKGIGSWAFALNRLTGLGLAIYLFLHLGVLSILLQGEGAWDDFVALVRSPIFLILDVILLFGLVFHGLNGLRLSLVGSGFLTKKQRPLFWSLMIIGLILVLIASWLIFSV